MRKNLQLSKLTSWRMFPGRGAERANLGRAQWSPGDKVMKLRVRGRQGSYSSQSNEKLRRELHPEIYRAPPVLSIVLTVRACEESI